MKPSTFGHNVIYMIFRRRPLCYILKKNNLWTKFPQIEIWETQYTLWEMLAQVAKCTKQL